MGSGAYYSGTVFWKDIYAGNILMSKVTTPVSGQYYRLTAEQLTVDEVSALIEAISPTSFYSTATIKNSLLANVTNLYGSAGSAVNLGASAINGFYNVPAAAQFGWPRTILSGDSPFVTAGSGEHYLRSDSAVRGIGASTINSTTKAALAVRTTQVPSTLKFPTVIDRDTLWTPWAARDTDANPDLGYHYPVIDYLVSVLQIYQARVRATAGTVIASDARLCQNMYGLSFGGAGLWVLDDATLECVGTPANFTRVVAAETVHEAFNLDAVELLVNHWATFPSIIVGGWTPTARLDARFTEFSALTTFARYTIGSGADAMAFNGEGIFSEVTLRDCRVRGGEFTLSPGPNADPGSVGIHNTLFERVDLFAWSDNASALELRNNLFRGGRVDLLAPWLENGATGWVVTDNLLDRCLAFCSGTVPHDYNAYFLPVGAMRLQPEAAHDVMFSQAPAYQTGTAGSFYLPATAVTHNAGSRYASDAGLAQYTTLVNQTRDGSETTPADRLDIGLHYAARSGSAPLDSDGDGILNVFEDANGNGDATDDPNRYDLADSDSNGVSDGNEDSDADGVTDAMEWALGTDMFNADEDYDQDGNSNLTELQLGTSPLTADNPITILDYVDGQNLPAGTVQIRVQIGQGFAANQIWLEVDGNLLEGMDPVDSPLANPVVMDLDTHILPNGIRRLRAAGKIRKTSQQQALPETWTLGKSLSLGIANTVSFAGCKDASGTMDLVDPWESTFTTVAQFNAVIDAPSAEYTLEILDASGAVLYSTAEPQLAQSGIVDYEWDLTKDDGNTFACEPGESITVRLCYHIPSLAEYLAHLPGSRSGTVTSPQMVYSPLERWPDLSSWLLAYSPLSQKEPTMNTFAEGILAPLARVQDQLAFSGLAWFIQPLVQERNFYLPYRVDLKVDCDVVPAGSFVTVDPEVSQSELEAHAYSWKLLRDSLTNDATRNIWLIAHGSPTTVGGDRPNFIPSNSAVFDEYGTLPLSAASQIEASNIKSLMKAWKHLYRFVFLDGCLTGYYTSWAEAFQIPTRCTDTQAKFDRRFKDRHGNYRERPRAFVGWKTYKVIDVHGSGMQAKSAWRTYREHFRDVWTQDLPYQAQSQLAEALDSARTHTDEQMANEASSWTSEDLKKYWGKWGTDLRICGWAGLKYTQGDAQLLVDWDDNLHLR